MPVSPKHGAAATPPGEPPFYEATEDLYIGGDPGVKPVRAYRAGSRVSPHAVEKNGWSGKVRVPAQFAVASPPPPPAKTTPAKAGGEE